MDIFPAIDLLDGKCVRLYQGDYAKSEIFNDNPADMAKSWLEQGANKLHLVDLDGAKAGKPVKCQRLQFHALMVVRKRNSSMRLKAVQHPDPISIIQPG
jgi:phosphoribosylformimino-5-aminoimidazole carboxamide ribotide isomerase